MELYYPHPAIQHLISCYRVINFGNNPTFNQPWMVSPSGYNTLTILISPASVLDIGRGENMRARIRFSGQLDGVRHFSSDVCLNTGIFVEFKPGAAYTLLGIPQQNFTNRWAEVNDFLPNTSTLYNLLDDSYHDIKKIIAVVDNWLLEQAVKSKKDCRKELMAAMQLIKESNGRIDIVQLRNHIGMTRASFQNHFKEQIGVSPKMYSRIIRANALYKEVLQMPTLDWQQIIHDYQFFDQAHLIKDFKHFFGHSPSHFFEQSQFAKDFSNLLDDMPLESD